MNAESRDPSMKLLSLNVGLPREVSWSSQKVRTAIFKEPVEGAVMLRRLNLDGDRQADLSVHGGPSKAAYVYPAEHYGYFSGVALMLLVMFHELIKLLFINRRALGKHQDALRIKQVFGEDHTRIKILYFQFGFRLFVG